MANIFTHIPYKETGYFSKLVTDYISNDPAIQPFYSLPATADGLTSAIKDRQAHPVNRTTLVEVLTKQYEHLPHQPDTHANIRSLLSENTFTICTAHQPNLLTGYLYFIYKILHAIKLAEQLNEKHPGKHFVPVYYMGSEDNDLAELGTFKFRGDKYVWDGDGQSGAVGRMDTASIKKLLADLLKYFGPPGSNCDELSELLTTAYLKHATIGSATQYLVHALFGRYGLVVLDPDDAALKSLFIPVMKDELLHQNANPVITKQIELLAAHYKIQAHPREINLFYLVDGLRERIEKKADNWIVINTALQFSEHEILAELENHPERFSPNVMLRGLFQETILPNIAFIGGGAEVAYWLQLRTVFQYYKVFFPVIYLRQSVLWIEAGYTKLREQLQLSVADIFKQDQNLVRDYISRHTNGEWQTSGETAAIENIFNSLEQKAILLDPTLEKAAGAALTKMKYQLEILEKKMLRAEKRKMETHLLRIEKLKKTLFPNHSLQERVENFSEYYLQYGPSFFDILKDGIDPFHPQFLIVEESGV